MKILKLLVYVFSCFCLLLIACIYLYYFQPDLQQKKEFISLTLQTILLIILLLSLSCTLSLLILFVHVVRKKPSGWFTRLFDKLISVQNEPDQIKYISGNSTLSLPAPTSSPTLSTALMHSTELTPDSATTPGTAPTNTALTTGTTSTHSPTLDTQLTGIALTPENDIDDAITSSSFHESKLIDDSASLNTFDYSPESIVMINHLLDRKQIYRDKHLAIDSFAEAVGITKKELTAILRERYNSGFIQLISKYRVGHAVAMLADKNNNNLKVEYIGWESGFSSRSTFYNTFAQYKGLPPSVYRQQLKNQ